MFLYLQVFFGIFYFQYGFFLHSLADLVVKEHGGDTWRKICLACGGDIAGGHVFMHRQYSEKLTNQLLEYSAYILDVSLETLLEKLGQQFLEFCKQSGYHRFLVALGSTLHDLLSNLDVIYHHLETFYPAMCPPTFHCSPVSDGSLLLEYRTKRPELVPFLCGLIKAMAMDFFQLEVAIEVEAARKDSEPSTLLISDKAAQALRRRKRASSLAADFSQFRASSNPKDLSISMEMFGILFPFHIMINRNMEVVQAGSKLKPLLAKAIKAQSCSANKLKFHDIFVIQRPLIPALFTGILTSSNSLFTLKVKPIYCNSTGNTGCTTPSSTEDSFSFRGQMIYIPESDYILFAGSPRAQELTSLTDTDLYLTDIPTHDVTRDLFLVSQSRRQGRQLVKQLEETSSNLLQMRETLEHEKKKTDTLLHSMLPQHIAQELRLNKRAKGQKFELVTVLCSDIVQFTSLCGHERIVPMDIIRVLNKLYTQFDALTSIHSVCKVETIGDAYHIVGGLPAFTAEHADRVIAMAFDMIDVCSAVLSPANGKPIQVRLGVHSGECVAGVVGQKKPRYCLFGRTITVASQMEGCSLPGRINITEETKRYLTTHATTNLLFEENKHKDPPWRCYLLSRSPQHQRHSSFALGLPPMKGMFKTPNPSPPSSLEASPCDSPLFPVPRLKANEIWLSVQSQRAVECRVSSCNDPPETFVFDFSSEAVLSSRTTTNTNTGTSRHELPSHRDALKSGENLLGFENEDKLKPTYCENPGLSCCVVIDTEEDVEETKQDTKQGRDQTNLSHRYGDQKAETSNLNLSFAKKEDKAKHCSDHKETDLCMPLNSDTTSQCSYKLHSPPALHSCGQLKSHHDNQSEMDQQQDQNANHSTASKVYSLTPGMARRNGLNRRFSDIDASRYSHDDTLVLYFRSCKSGPTSPCYE